MTQHDSRPSPARATALPMLLVDEGRQSCPYLPNQTARMPLHWPYAPLSGESLDRLLQDGYRRSGMFVYRTACPRCDACEPTRIEVEHFQWTTSLRRVLRRGDAALRVQIAEPTVDDARVVLFNRHREQRSLNTRNERWVGEEEYSNFLVESCCETREISYWRDGRLVGVAIVDVGAKSLSAVYCFFEPEESRLSIGTYSILKQLQMAQETRRPWLYLGLYVADNPHLNYKSRFLPQQRRVDEQWQTYS